MRRTTKLLSVTALLTMQFATISAFANGPMCIAAVTGSLPSTTMKPDLQTFMQGTPLLKGGVDPGSPIFNQRMGEICWSYALKRIVMGWTIKLTGKPDYIAPDHNAFWHNFDQITSHPRYFAEIRKKVAAGMSIDDAVNMIVKLMKENTSTAEKAAAGFVVEQGSDEPTALTEALKYGMSPAELFDRPITSLQQAADLDAALKRVVAQVISSPHTSLGNNDSFGISNNLYNLFVKEVVPVLNASVAPTQNGQPPLNPIRPGQTFTLADGSTHTTSTYMTDYLKMNPKDWNDVRQTSSNLDLIHQAIEASLKANFEVAVGWPVFNQKQLEQINAASTDILQGQVVLAGGHATVITNQRKIQAQYVGNVMANSWGPQGTDADGNPTGNPEDSGYDIITPGYLIYGLQSGNPSDFLFHNSIVNANSPFASLLKQIVRH